MGATQEILFKFPYFTDNRVKRMTDPKACVESHNKPTEPLDLHLQNIFLYNGERGLSLKCVCGGAYLLKFLGVAPKAPACGSVSCYL